METGTILAIIYATLALIGTIITMMYYNKKVANRQEAIKAALATINKANSFSDSAVFTKSLENVKKFAINEKEYEKTEKALIKLFNERVDYANKSNQQKVYLNNLSRRY